MSNAKTQYVVSKAFIDHLESKIIAGGSDEEFIRFRRVKIEFLDTLADLLNNPKIAKEWDNKE